MGKYVRSSSAPTSKLKKLSYSLPADMSTEEGAEFSAEKSIK